mgnify:CR=1 FL=1
MKSRIVKVVGYIMAIFLIVMIISQIVIKFNVSYKEETALPYSTSRTVAFQAVFIRNEQVIDKNMSGVLSFAVSNGSKVAKNSVVAQAYSSQQDINYQTQAKELEKKISSLKDAQALVGADNSQLDSFNKQISEKHLIYMDYIQKKDFSSASDVKNELYSLYIKRDIIKGEINNYNDKIQQVEQELSRIKSLISKSAVPVTSDSPGYFSSSVDGLEGELSKGNLNSITADRVKEIVQNPPSAISGKVGKLIDDYEWYAVAVVDSSAFAQYHQGAVLSLRSDIDGITIKALLEKKTDLNDGTSLIFFSNDVLNENFASNRVVQFKLIQGDYSGIRITRDALRQNENNEYGVYVRVGTQIFFRKIDIMYWEEEYVVVENSVEDGYVSAYDNYIVKGKDLYDGKVIKS